MDQQTARTVLKAIEGARTTELRDDLYRHCVRYARLRTDWALASMEERRAMDERRQLAHTAVIHACTEVGDAVWNIVYDNTVLGRIDLHAGKITGSGNV